MPVLIYLAGPGGTGKTTSIKTAMASLGINVLRPSGDVTLDVPQYAKAGVLRQSGIGFASGGDNRQTVINNCNFFRGKSLDCMVMACRSGGGGYQELLLFAQSLSVTPVWILTQKQLAGNIAATIQANVTRILAAIP